MCSGSRNVFKFLEITDNILEQCKIETKFQWTANEKSYVACHMAAITMSLSDLKGHLLLSVTFLTPILWKM